MDTKKTVRKRTSKARKKKVATDVVQPDTTEADSTPPTDKAEAPSDADAPQKPRRRRSRKKVVASEPASTPTATETTEVVETESDDQQSAADTPAPKRRRSTKRRSRKRTGATASTETTERSEPTAEKSVDRQEDAIIIRFPSAAPEESDNAFSVRAEPAAPPAPPEPVADEAEGAKPDAPAEEPISEEQPSEKPADSEARPSRRRRRGRGGRGRKRKPEANTEVATPSSDEPETATEPESSPAKQDDADEQADEQRPKRRRRRSRRSRRDGESRGEVLTDPRPTESTDSPAEKAHSTGKEMIVNVVPNEECRIAILEGGKLEEIYLERASAENHVGNIYKGVITNVESSIQAAFIDFGLPKNGFLHVSDLHPQYFPNGEGQSENVGRKIPRRNRPPIQQCLRRGQEVMVQIIKEGIGTKGPTLTTYLSIPGRFLVMMPGMRQLGVSRKIEDEDLRRKLRDQLGELTLPDDIGFIARTAAENRTKRELQSDLNYLQRLWRAVEKRIEKEKAPAELYRDSDLVIRTIRDVFTNDIDRILIDNEEVANRSREFLSIFSPRARDTIVLYEGKEPIFHKYGIENELQRLHSRHVPLKSGGSLVIDQTEALVAIDVNSGRFRTENNAESTAYKIDMEAADEIARQLRLRDLGGVVVCDFIDVREEKHKRDIERRLANNLKVHKERAKVLRMSAFGIIELTRQRQRASLTRSVYQDCHQCGGTGLVKTGESVTLDVMRSIQLAVTRETIRTIEVTVSSEVGNLLLNRKRAVLHELEVNNQRNIVIRPDSAYGLDQVQIQCYDHRGRLVPNP